MLSSCMVRTCEFQEAGFGTVGGPVTKYFNHSDLGKWASSGLSNDAEHSVDVLKGKWNTGVEWGDTQIVKNSM